MMEIRINGKAADITLDTENTIGEVMASLEGWLANSGHRLSGISIDGKTAGTAVLEDFFLREVDSVKVLDIFTNSIAELTAESLLNLLADIKDFEGLKYDERNNYTANWKESAQALFALEQFPDLYDFYINYFSGQVNSQVIVSVTEERLREVNDPHSELTNLQPLLEETCTRLADFSLDVQTGKDARAAATIQLFSGLAEKIFRLIKQLDNQGFLSQKADEKKSFNQVIDEFGKLIKELLQAYEKHDSILTGDLAEYEVSPKLKELYTFIMNNKSKTGSG